MSDIRFDIQSLHAAYAAGLPIAEVIDTVFARIDDGGDPGIFIHLADAADLMAQARALGDIRSRGKAALGRSVRRQGQHRRRGHADHCRLPRLCLFAREGRNRGRRAEGGRRAGRRQDQSRPVRHRPRRRAHALPHPEKRGRSEASAGRLIVRLGSGDGAWHRFLRARHRHGRLRPHSGRLEQHRRAEADGRRALGQRRRAGLPHARLRVGLRPDGRGRLVGLRDCRRSRCRRSLFEDDRNPAACPPAGADASASQPKPI